MNEVNAESPRRKARLAGLFYALDIVTGRQGGRRLGPWTSFTRSRGGVGK